MNSSSLEHMQASVERHFDKLSTERRAAGLTVFALEHGLSKNEVNDLSQGLRQHIVYGGELSTLWLLWVVYATELGYDFDGEEYWQSYERRTPQWKDDPDRRKALRRFFERFESKFGGTKPTGHWARQFSIIARPITHAVLPRDLQSQMARALFEYRHEIAETAGDAAARLGSLIARRAEGASSRFKNFLEQEELAGRIAMALLFPDANEFCKVLTPSTMARIVADLETSWESKSWMSEARKVVNEVKIRLEFTRATDVKTRRSDSREGRETAEAKCVAPTVSLRQTNDGAWRGFIEVPSFAGWARANPQVDALVRRSRCKVKGTEDVWHSRRWLIFGAQELRIIEWPTPGSSWLRFEEREEETVRLVEDECCVRARPWLFQVDEDGCAYQLNGKSVKPGRTYIVLHSGEFESNDLFVPARLDAKGSVAHVLSVPAQATEFSVRCLNHLGLSAARTLKVWPAGLPPLGFGDDQILEWSARLPLTLGVEHDETCDAFTVQIDSRRTTFSTTQRKVSFVEVGKMPPGVHQISVSAAYRAADGTSKLRVQATPRSFLLVVRSPLAGFASRRHAPVLIVTPDPPNPSLDAMMSALATCTVHGPVGRAVDFHLELMNGSGEIVHSEVLGTLELPVDSGAWRKLVTERDAADSFGESYFKANSGQLVVDAHDLGKAVVPLKHSMSPVRWHVARKQRQVRLNLVDDTDHSEPVSTYHACFHQPSRCSAVWDGTQATCIDVADGGGLYVVAANGHRSSIVVNAPPIKMSLSDLKNGKPTLQPYLSNGQQVAELLGWIRDWADARLVGPFAENRRNTVLRELHRQLYASLCDPGWANAELAFKDSNGAQAAREVLESRVWGNPLFAIGLVRHAEAIVTSSLDETCTHLLDHVAPYSICSSPHLCALALRIAIAPHGFADWAGAGACDRIDEIVNQKALLKAARLLALIVGMHGQLLARDW